MRIEYLSFSIYVAGLLSLLRFRKINKEYRPFLYLIWLACLNESVSALLSNYGISVNYNNNLYSIGEALLYLWLFKKTGIIHGDTAFRLLSISFLVVWIINNYFAWKGINPYNSYFNFYYAFIIILFCIQTINQLLLRERAVLSHPLFLIAVGAIFFFTFSIIVEVFWVYGLGVNEEFSGKIFRILMWVNFFCNFLFAAAVSTMKKRVAIAYPF